MDKNELMLHNHTNIQELIRFIDQKAGALLVIYGFILTAAVEFAKDLKFVNPFELKTGLDTFLSIFLFLIGIVLLGLIVSQVYFVLFEIIKPRDAEEQTQEEASVIYFGHISQKSKDEFLTMFSNITDADAQKEMLKQIHEISCIMSTKSENFNKVLKSMFWTVLVLLLFIFLSKVV